MAKCKCGCGEDVRDGQTFVRFHYSKWMAAHKKKNSVHREISAVESRMDRKEPDNRECSLADMVKATREGPSKSSDSVRKGGSAARGSPGWAGQKAKVLADEPTTRFTSDVPKSDLDITEYLYLEEGKSAKKSIKKWKLAVLIVLFNIIVLGFIFRYIGRF